MHGWALATFVKGMKIRLRKNWLSILAKRKIPQSRNCLWCDELMINYDRYGLCCVWRGLCNQECMNEWPRITFCNNCLFFGLSAQQSVMAMIVPRPHYDFFLVAIFFFVARHFGNFAPPPPPPPPKQSPWRCPYPIMVIILPQKISYSFSCYFSLPWMLFK